MTQKELSNKIGISPTTMSDYMNGRSKPSHGVVQKIADFFNVGKSDIDTTYKDSISPTNDILLIYNKLHKERQERVYMFAKYQLEAQNEELANPDITVLEDYKEQRREKIQDLEDADWLGIVSAGNGEWLGEDNSEVIQLPKHIIPLEADYCLTINGDSMEPMFHDQSYVFLKKDVELHSGMIGVFILNGEAYLKRIWFENDGARLESFNPKYKDIYVTKEDDFKCVGQVVL
ncbi:hypothetical protein RV18_GL001081 [Enterococcus termitis]|nr:hypothetical protein RV18_GL001081 [Enterococcus termitis]